MENKLQKGRNALWDWREVREGKLLKNNQPWYGWPLNGHLILQVADQTQPKVASKTAHKIPSPVRQPVLKFTQNFYITSHNPETESEGLQCLIQTPEQMIFMTPVPSFYTEKLMKASSWDTVQKLYHTCTNVEPIWAKYLKCIRETNIFFKNFLPVWQSLRSRIHKPFLLLIVGLFHITCHCWS